MYYPLSTYRIQLHKGFTFSDLEKVIPYLHRLGVKTIYASPIFEAVPGSMHGYDVVNPLQINPEIGTEAQLRQLHAKLKNLDMGWIQDIVPNHMAFHSSNKWLMDVLEHGADSTYFSYFDFSDPGKIMVPLFESDPESCVKAGKLKVAYVDERFVLKYGDLTFPLKPASDAEIRLLEYHTYDCVERVNHDPALLLRVISEQHYRLCAAQEANTYRGYRRFFTVNGLISLNVQHEHVFQHTHRYIAYLLKEGIFQGLRVDHIDGLYDPGAYLQRLRMLAGEETYIVVEKILQPGESLPKEWPVQGTTGYDFLGIANYVQADAEGYTDLHEYYNSWSPGADALTELHEKKKLILLKYMRGDLDHLCGLFGELQDLHDVPAESVRDAIADLLIYCPVYRYYVSHFPLDKANEKAIRNILKQIPHRSRALVLLEKTLLEEPAEHYLVYSEKVLNFYRRCMQVSGPLMAKGFEDTLMYTWNACIGLNDVGSSPFVKGYTHEQFHHDMLLRRQDAQLSLNATSTHDTKRGEDARARLSVLTGLSYEWMTLAEQWNLAIQRNMHDDIPDRNDAYLISRALIGSLPPGHDDHFRERLEAFLKKALRESKRHSSWENPDNKYEDAANHFALRVMDDAQSVLKGFHEFQRKVADAGMLNALAQLLLKCTVPGVPDIYQGTELWDFSFVDPDNRRAVDYEQRARLLEGLEEEKVETLWHLRSDGRVKLWLTAKLLHMRQSDPLLWEKGTYIPLEVKGKYARHILAFARRYGTAWTVIAMPVQAVQLAETDTIMDFDWKETRIVLPPELPARYKQLLVPGEGRGAGELRIKDIFHGLPLAVLKFEYAANDRGSGLLLPVSALPSAFGIGDLGPEALRFADFLGRSCQRYWQMLPLNPTEIQHGNSPYSSVSSMAGNPLLISPEWLADLGLLDEEELKHAHQAWSRKIDYEAAKKSKYVLLGKAYHRFCSGNFAHMQHAFRDFCEQEADWLNDFALFVVLRETYATKPWYEWPAPHRDRDPEALKSFESAQSGELGQVKWRQFIFHEQWKKLKAYCHTLGIKLFGDIPFYVNHDSADVWANRHLFALNEDGTVSRMAGVPPDYFSEKGQLWGMPVFRWEMMKEQQYDWWIRRLQKNFKHFDLLRIDHFRAFAAYWEVPAGQETAEHGGWRNGPGAEFFQVVESRLGHLQLIAEDLGEEMEQVYALRDEVGLPGMKVLQFAFGENMPVAVDVPHRFTPNCIAYTGTHDNNTARGWFVEETDKATRKRLDLYAGMHVTEKNVHLVLGRMAQASVARMAILPVQDILGLPANARSNTPGTAEDNWTWCMDQEELGNKAASTLRMWAKIYNRI